MTQRKAQFRGAAIEPTGSRYEEALGVYSATISLKRPLIALGESIGYLTPNSGLAIDNLLASDVVLATVSFVLKSDRRTR